MDTTITIKTKKNLIKEAKELAEEMGVTMTSVVNAFLRQFVRNRELTLTGEETLTKEKIEFLERISKDADEGKNISGPFYDLDSLFKHLKISG